MRGREASIRILHVIQELTAGGAERATLLLADGAEQAGCDVFVAAGAGALEAELTRPRLPVPIVGRNPARIPGAALAVHRAIRACRPDVIHSHNPGMALATSLATWRGRRPPALASFHGVPDEDYPAAARTLRLAGLPVVACGPGVAAGLAEQGLPPAATILNAVGPAPPAADRSRLERELGISPGRQLAVSVGRLVEQKNHALALAAVSRLPKLVLLVLGEGELRASLEQKATELGVADRVILPGVRTDARAIVAAADVFVLPSQWEGLPLVVLEALAAGTPVVATAVRGIRELLTDGVDALLVPTGDAAALAAAIQRVLADPALAGSLTSAGGQLAKRHGEDEMVAAFLRLYRRLAAGESLSREQL